MNAKQRPGREHPWAVLLVLTMSLFTVGILCLFFWGTVKNGWYAARLLTGHETISATVTQGAVSRRSKAQYRFEVDGAEFLGRISGQQAGDVIAVAYLANAPGVNRPTDQLWFDFGLAIGLPIIIGFIAVREVLKSKNPSDARAIEMAARVADPTEPLTRTIAKRSQATNKIYWPFFFGLAALALISIAMVLNFPFEKNSGNSPYASEHDTALDNTSLSASDFAQNEDHHSDPTENSPLEDASPTANLKPKIPPTPRRIEGADSQNADPTVPFIAEMRNGQNPVLGIEDIPQSDVNTRDSDRLIAQTVRPSITIVRARFGTGNKWEDVTDNIRSILSRDPPRFINSAKGLEARDPLPGYKKKTIITYRIDGREQRVTIKAGPKRKYNLREQLK